MIKIRQNIWFDIGKMWLVKDNISVTITERNYRQISSQIDENHIVNIRYISPGPRGPPEVGDLCRILQSLEVRLSKIGLNHEPTGP